LQQGGNVALPEEILWLEGGQTYCVCAFYTPNYLPQILALKASVETLGINHYFRRYEPRGGWEANTRIKADFVVHALGRVPKHDVAYLDADSIVRKPLTLFDAPTADVTILFAHRRKNKLEMLRIAAGTLLVRNTPGGRKFADRWAQEAAKAQAIDVDEDLIYRIIPTLDGVTFAVLPRSYYKIFDAVGGEPVIEHFQASRGQFKWRKAMRRSRQVGTIVGGVALALLMAWVWTNLTISWR
jgi:hypothetical protein